MATTTQQSGFRGLHSGLLPPCRELFLEIQVNKLINEFLFPRNAEMLPSAHDRNEAREEVKDKALPNGPVKEAIVNMQSLDVEGDFVFESLDMASLRNPNEGTGSPQKEILAKELRLYNANAACEGSSFGNTADEAQKAHHLSRMVTFPCANKAKYPPNRHTDVMVNSEVKFGAKKPPRPPQKLPKSSSSNQLPQQLGRCSSDTNVLFLSVRRNKFQRKKKVAGAECTPSASTWALLCTFCFVILMVAQGFWSEGGSRLPALDGSIASSPTAANAKSITSGTSQDVVMVRDGQQVLERDSSAQEMVQDPWLLEPRHQGKPDALGNLPFI